jgi:predicted RNA binding protein YcfA (HicA-like mRNA interferase family)
MHRKPRHKYREAKKILRKFGIQEQPSRGKGSHRVFFHPNFRGKPRFYPVKCHNPNQQLTINQTFLPNFSFKKKSLIKRNTKEKRKEKFHHKK